MLVTRCDILASWHLTPHISEASCLSVLKAIVAWRCPHQGVNGFQTCDYNRELAAMARQRQRERWTAQYKIYDAYKRPDQPTCWCQRHTLLSRPGLLWNTWSSTPGDHASGAACAGCAKGLGTKLRDTTRGCFNPGAARHTPALVCTSHFAASY